MAALVRFRTAFGAGNYLLRASKGATLKATLANPLRGCYSTGELPFWGWLPGLWLKKGWTVGRSAGLENMICNFLVFIFKICTYSVAFL